MSERRHLSVPGPCFSPNPEIETTLTEAKNNDKKAYDQLVTLITTQVEKRSVGKYWINRISEKG